MLDKGQIKPRVLSHNEFDEVAEELGLRNPARTNAFHVPWEVAPGQEEQHIVLREGVSRQALVHEGDHALRRIEGKSTYHDPPKRILGRDLHVGRAREEWRVRGEQRAWASKAGEPHRSFFTDLGAVLRHYLLGSSVLPPAIRATEAPDDIEYEVPLTPERTAAFREFLKRQENRRS